MMVIIILSNPCLSPALCLDSYNVMPTGAHEFKNTITFVSTKSWLNTPHFKCAVGPRHLKPLWRMEEKGQYEWGIDAWVQVQDPGTLEFSPQNSASYLTRLIRQLAEDQPPKNSSLEKYRRRQKYFPL